MVVTCELMPQQMSTDEKDPTTLSEEDCRALRRAAENGKSAGAAVDDLGLDIHPTTARIHAKGECGCDTAVPAHQFRAWERQITPDDCALLRQLAADGASVRTAVVELGLEDSEAAAHYHVRGDCTCDTDVPARPRRTPRIGPEDCTSIRRAAKNGLSSSTVLEELGLDLTRHALHYHANGDTCDADIPPHRFDPSRKGIDPAGCEALRQLAGKGVSASAAIETLDLDVIPAVARRHAKGDCNCDTDGSPHPFGRQHGTVSPAECEALRRKAQQGLSSSAAVDDLELDVLPEVARSHARGDCACNADVPPHSFPPSKSVSQEDCSALRRLASEGLSAKAAINDLELGVHPSTVRAHARGDCGCDTDTSAHPFRSTRRVTPEDCEALRRLAADGVSATGAVEELEVDISDTIAYWHARGDCGCAIDVAPHPFDHKDGVVGPGECRALRRAAENGVSSGGAVKKLELDVNQQTATYHARGDCGCEVEVAPHPFAPPNTVSPEDCGTLRRLASEGMPVPAAIEECGLDIESSTASYHANGHCTCDTDVPPHSFHPLGKVTPGDCGELRQLAADGWAAPAAMEELELDVTIDTVRRHARGNCSCSTDAPPHAVQGQEESSETDGVSPKECADIRRQLQSGTTVESVDAPYTNQIVEVHGTGDCPHEIEESPVLVPSGSSMVTSELCELINRLYYEQHHHTGQIKDNLEDSFDIDINENRIKKHVVGTCAHDEDQA